MNNETLSLLLNVGVFAPLLGAVLIAIFNEKQAKLMALLIMAVSLLAGVAITADIAMASDAAAKASNGYFCFQDIKWFGAAGYDISYQVGVDGISAFMLLLTVVLFPLLVIYGWGRERKQEKMFYIMLLLLETGLLGFFVSLDMLLFYIFFELVLIPGSFLIGIWGNENKGEAALKFFIYTLLGSLLMLIGIIYMGIHAGAANGMNLSTDYFAIQELIAGGELPAFAANAQWWLFAAFAISFAIKAPVFPFHTWQAQAYASASTEGTVILAALLSKMGAYGFLRFCLPLFPEAVDDFAPVLAILGVIGIIYGAYMAVVQNDMKRLLAFSSLSHMGFIILGIFAVNYVSISGAVYQMLAHGVSTAALFLLVDMLERRYGSRQISDFQGLAKVAPAFTVIFMISMLASVGLPGLSGFVGEFMIMTGAFASGLIGKGITVFAAIGVVLAAVYLLNMFRKVMFGKMKENLADFKKPEAKETWVLIPMVIFMFWLGLYATPFLNPINKGTENILKNTVKVDSYSMVEHK